MFKILNMKRTKQYQGFYDLIFCDKFTSELVVPTHAFVWNPVTLTIRIRYSLNFADGQQGTIRPGIIMLGDDDEYYAVDSNKRYFGITEWDFASAREFAHKFQRGQAFWDRKFMLITPDDFEYFDYQLPDNKKDKTAWRPNVLCRFELLSVPTRDIDGDGIDSEPKVHLDLDAVRTEWSPWNFRSHMWLYDEGDVDEDTLFHEIGHALDQDHIQALLGLDKTCSIDDSRQGAGHCYDTPGFGANVMGRGDELVLENAKPWVDLIARHTVTRKADWKVSRDVVSPPRLVKKKPLDNIDIYGNPIP